MNEDKPEHTICDTANELWNRFIETKNESDRDKFTNHVMNCEADYKDEKKPWEYPNVALSRNGYTDDEIKEIEQQLHDINIPCTADSAMCDMCSYEIECLTVFLKFENNR